MHRKFVKFFPELIERNALLIHRIPPDMQMLFAGELESSDQGVGETFMAPRPGYW
ncbi:TPA: glycosidase, partial [Candidatus Poribacteria bacterium]|nr:glycosidase [Candidatus Poribacteria bacterium]HEX30177.1 glycosidase [Candidatus Poribacteria bacterium]